MRMRDAEHVDLGSFYARKPGLGRVYRWFGYGACLAVLYFAHDPGRITGLAIALLVAWIMAWKREVGALWRTSLVTALVLCGAILTADRLGYRMPQRCRMAQDGCMQQAPAAERTIIMEVQP